MNFKKLGNNVTISPKASIYRPEMIEIGDDVRIDDFCILSAGDGGIKIGNNVHIACYTSFIGKGAIIVRDRAQFAQRVYLMSSCDDFSGAYLAGPCVPEHLRNVKHGDIIVGEESILGVGAIVFPGVNIGANSAIGALSIVKGDIPENVIYAGVPAKFIKDRKKRKYEVEDSIKYFSYQAGE